MLCCKFFIDRGYPLSEHNVHTYLTPLHYAVYSRSAHIVQLLIQSGAKVTAMNIEGKTPLDIAQEKGFTDIVRLMESLLASFVGYIEKKGNTGIMSTLLNTYQSKWVVIMNKLNGDSYPDGGRLVYYDTNTSAQPKKVFPLYGAKLHFEDPPEALTVTLVTQFPSTKLKLRAPDDMSYKNLVGALTGQNQNVLMAPPAPHPPAFPPSHSRPGSFYGGSMAPAMAIAPPTSVAGPVPPPRPASSAPALITSTKPYVEKDPIVLAEE
jgi:hypothetical protein